MNMLSTGYPQNNEQMFLLPIASKRKEWYIEYKGSERMFVSGGIIMEKEKYKKIIIEIVEKINDKNILIKIYTVVKNLTS